MENRRKFLKKTITGAAGLTLGGIAFAGSPLSYRSIIGSNEKIRVGVIGFSDRFKASLLPCFLEHAVELNFEIVALSDIWSVRRQEGKAYIQEKTGRNIALCVNNDELYSRNDIDAVIISTADFQHAMHLTEAAKAKKDAYVEKPFAETMNDARTALQACRENGIIVQVGSQRRSGKNYQAANDYIRSGRFGDIIMVEMCWNVNQPGRWRRPALVAAIREQDTDWKRYLLNRPVEPWDPRKYLEFRLFWPYSSGIPGQWMCHQIDTVHWFTGLSHPRSVAANGGIYQWKDGRTNADTLTAVFDYGPTDNPGKGFQVVYTSRFSNAAGGTKELYYSNAGMLNLDNNTVTPEGGLQASEAAAMNLTPNLLEAFKLPEITISTGANTSDDPLTSAHMRNWMECVRSRKQTQAPVEAGFNHAVACVMANAAYRTGMRTTFSEATQEVMAGGKAFLY
jgi:predicted dehydrogenase